MSHVFLSYCHEDVDFAQILREELSRGGIATWKDVDLRAGAHWANEIENAIKEAVAVVVVLSLPAQASQYVNFEWAYAQGAGIPVVPVLLKISPERLHPRLRDLHALDFSNYVSRPWDALISRLLEITSTKRESTFNVPRDAPPVLRQAAQAMSGLNEGERIAAIKTLAKMDDPAALDVLVEALEHPLGDVRTAATIALAKKGDLRAIKGYFAAVRDEYFEQLNAAEIDLSSFGPAALPQLIAAATDTQENQWVRVRALNALRRIESPEAMHTIQQCLNDSNSEIRVNCLRLLKGIDASRPLLISRFNDPENFVVYVAVQSVEGLRGADLVAALIDVMKHPDYAVRSEAADRLGEIGDPAAMPILVEALQDENENVRSCASRAVKKVGNETALPALLAALATSPHDSKPRIMSVLGKIGGPGAIGPLLDWLKSDIPDYRTAAAFALGDLQAVAAVPDLLKALNDFESEVRNAAAVAIEEIKPEGAVPALKAILDDDLEDNSDVLNHIVAALKAIGTREARLAAREWERIHKKS
jgi:HEAT repeat protein